MKQLTPHYLPPRVSAALHHRLDPFDVAEWGGHRGSDTDRFVDDVIAVAHGLDGALTGICVRPVATYDRVCGGLSPDGVVVVVYPDRSDIGNALCVRYRDLTDDSEATGWDAAYAIARALLVIANRIAAG